MVSNNGVCKDRDMAMAIIMTITAGMKAGTQRAALESVAEWIRSNTHDDVSKLTPEQRRDRVLEIETGMRDCMTDEQRKAKAAFYLEGLKEKAKPPAQEG